MTTPDHLTANNLADESSLTTDLTDLENIIPVWRKICQQNPTAFHYSVSHLYSFCATSCSLDQLPFFEDYYQKQLADNLNSPAAETYQQMLLLIKQRQTGQPLRAENFPFITESLSQLKSLEPTDSTELHQLLAKNLQVVERLLS